MSELAIPLKSNELILQFFSEGRIMIGSAYYEIGA